MSKTAGARRAAYLSVPRWIAAPLLVAAIGFPLAPVAVNARTEILFAQAKSISADDAAATVRARSGGRILDVRLRSNARRKVWRVKVLLPGGPVRVYRVDARSGRILR